MDKGQKGELARIAGSGVRFDCPMSGYTTFRVGGEAEALYDAGDMEVLGRVLAYLDEEGIFYLPVGRGSNLLVMDEGLKGVVIRLCGALASIEREEEDDLVVRAGAGMALADLLVYCRSSGLEGLEFLAGIPGTVGGAIAMNAGAFGSEVGERIREIQVITRGGEIVTRDQPGLRFAYRGLELENGTVIVRACLGLERGRESTARARMADYLRRRKESQPLEYPSAGSVFKNPPGDFAARLIEQAGLKGARAGGAMISMKHANYIVNTGGATAGDILELLNLARTRVKEETGIELEPEVKVIGW